MSRPRKPVFAVDPYIVGRIEDPNQYELYLRARKRDPAKANLPRKRPGPLPNSQLAYFCPAYTERFHAYTSDADANGCWLWQGSMTKDGYGLFAVMGTNITAHRYAKELQLGERIPRGLDASHTCPNRACVNPDHVVVTTRAETLARRLGDPSVRAARRKEKRRQYYATHGDELRRKQNERNRNRTEAQRRQSRHNQRVWYHANKEARREEVNRKSREYYARRKAKAQANVSSSAPSLAFEDVAVAVGHGGVE